jgi:hypothetical protein
MLCIILRCVYVPDNYVLIQLSQFCPSVSYLKHNFSETEFCLRLRCNLLLRAQYSLSLSPEVESD